MPVRRDPRTGGWFFRTIVKLPDGTKRRLFGTPGVPGPYQELEPTKLGAREAERRAIMLTIGEPTIPSAPSPQPQPVPEQAAPEQHAPTLATQEVETIRKHAETFVDLYKPSSKASEKREKRRVLNTHLLPFFGDMTIESLKQADLDRFAVQELGRGMVVKTVNNRLAVLSTLIKYVSGTKPNLRFKLDGMDAELHAVPWESFEKLLEVCDDDRYVVVLLLAAEAGLRAGEIRGLQWTDIKAEQITVRRGLDKQTNASVTPKHNKSRTIPVSPRLKQMLAKLPRQGLWVISEPDGQFVVYDDMSATVNEIYERAGVTRPLKPIHCLRHTFGTVMARRVPLPVLQRLMGHADVKTTLRYVDINEADKRNAIETVFGVAAAWQPRGSETEAIEGTGP